MRISILFMKKDNKKNNLFNGKKVKGKSTTGKHVKVSSAKELDIIDLDNTIELGNFLNGTEEIEYNDDLALEETYDGKAYYENNVYDEDKNTALRYEDISDTEGYEEYDGEAEYEEYSESDENDPNQEYAEYEEYSENEEYIENDEAAKYEEYEAYFEEDEIYDEASEYETDYPKEQMDEDIDEYYDEGDLTEEDLAAGYEEYCDNEDDGDAQIDIEDTYYDLKIYDEIEAALDDDSEEEEFVKRVSQEKKSKKEKYKNLSPVEAFFKSLSPGDYAMAGIILAVAVIIVIVATNLNNKTVEKSSESLYALGQDYASLTVPGKDGIFKMTQYAIDNSGESEEAEAVEEISENEVSGVKNAEVKFTSVEKDLKIKILDKDTNKPISGIEFEIILKDSQGTETNIKDSDKDGIIYQTGLEGGTYTVIISEVPDIVFALKEYTAEVKGQIEYKKIDIADEIKTEKEINAAQEDTAVNNVVEEEPTIKDTVEWVESTRTAADGSDGYTTISKDDIMPPDYSMREIIEYNNEKLTTISGRVGEYMKVMTLNKGEYKDKNDENDEDDRKDDEASNEKDDETKEATVTSIDLSDNTKTIEVGESFKLKATANFSDGTTEKSKDSTKFTFVPENNSIASADNTGTITGLSVGEVTIDVKYENIIVGCIVKVVEHTDKKDDDKKDADKKDADKKDDEKKDDGNKNENKPSESIPEEYDELESVVLNKTSVTLQIGANEALEAKAMAKNEYIIATDGKKFTWTSSDETIAKVGSKGKITAVKEGTATITASYSYKDVTKNCECVVTVVQKAENDTTSPLKTKDGRKIFVKDSEGNYREATFADYYTATEFFVEQKTDYKYTGWQTIDGNVYFFDKNGEKVTGEQVIQGVKYTFTSEGILATDKNGIKGIDVSSWQSSIDWTAVKNSGISFVIIRCGYRGSQSGALVEDSKFRGNITGAKAAGLKVGVYFFTQAVNEVEAVEEASMAVELAKNYGVGYPIFIDTEGAGGRADGLSKASRTAAVKAFCQTVQNSGYTAGVYASKDWYNSNVDYSQLSGYKIWLAQYASAPTFSNRYDLWQYSSSGSVGGIKGKVDMNISYLGY